MNKVWRSCDEKNITEKHFNVISKTLHRSAVSVRRYHADFCEVVLTSAGHDCIKKKKEKKACDPKLIHASP